MSADMAKPEINRPAGDREHVAAAPRDREPVHRGGHPEQGKLAVEEQRDLGDATAGLHSAQTNPVDVQRAELTLDDDPPRTGRVAGTQPDLQVLARARMLLERQGRAEDGPVVRAG